MTDKLDILKGAVEEKPLEVRNAVDNILQNKITDLVNSKKTEIAHNFFGFNPPEDPENEEELDDDNEDFDDESDEFEDDEEDFDDEEELEDFDDEDMEELEDDAEDFDDEDMEELEDSEVEERE